MLCWAAPTIPRQLILARPKVIPSWEVVQTLVEENILVGERGNYRVEKAPTDLHIRPPCTVLSAIDRLAADGKTFADPGGDGPGVP
jgi:hypothetical protein